MTSRHTKLEVVEIMVDKQKQNSRRNCLLIHGLEKEKDKNTDGLVLQIINTELDV